MKLMIASDIHGSLKYCRQLVEKYKEEKQVVIFKSREEADEYISKVK